MVTQVTLGSGVVDSAAGLKLRTNGSTEAVDVSTGQVVTLAQNPVLTSGTANGVAYLNGSKVVTSGSALVFDGTNLGVGTASPASGRKITVSNTGTDAAIRIDAPTGYSSYLELTENGSLTSGNYWQINKTPTTNAMQFWNGTERMRLDSAGNLGLNVTPSAWASPFKALQVSYGGIRGSTATLGLSHNAYYDGTNFNYIASGYASDYYQNASKHVWRIAPSWNGTGSPIISFTDAMTLDASGNLGVGTTSPTTRMSVVGPTAGTAANFTDVAGNGNLLVRFQAGSLTTLDYGSGNTLTINTGSTERARIDTSGNLLVGATSSLVSSTGGSLTVGVGGSSASNHGQIALNGSTASGYGAGVVGYSNGTNIWGVGTYGNFAGGTTTYLLCRNTSGGVYLNGVSATSWTSVSDETRKVIIEPITDAANKVSTLRAVIGRLKEDEETVRRPYLIAQDVQAVLPEAVSENEDKDGPVLGLSYTEVIPLLVAAIKEQQAIIQQLQAQLTSVSTDVAALKA